jgi:hypothetical protein
MGSQTTNRNYPKIAAGDNMRATSVPELAQLAEMVDADVEGILAVQAGQADAINDAGSLAASAQSAATEAAAKATTNTDDITALNSEVAKVSSLGKVKLDLLSSSTTLTAPAWLKPDGLASHVLTLGSGFVDGDVIIISDPKGTLPTTNISLVSETPGVELVENSDFSGGEVTIDHSPNGSHTVPASWDVQNPASVNAAAWSTAANLVSFEATASGGGMIEDAIYTLNVGHRVAVKARKVSGDTTARLILYVQGNAIDVDEMVIVPADDTNWHEFSGDIEPTVSTDLIIECRDGAAVWEIEYVRCAQFARFRLDSATVGESLNLDVGGISLAYDLEDNEWQKV